jgi:hypothetical protein
MNSKIITLDKLSSIIEVSPNALHIWLNGYRFTKFYHKKIIDFSAEFVREMAEFLKIKRRYGKAKLLVDYYKKISCR